MIRNIIQRGLAQGFYCLAFVLTAAVALVLWGRFEQIRPSTNRAGPSQNAKPNVTANSGTTAMRAAADVTAASETGTALPADFAAWVSTDPRAAITWAETQLEGTSRVRTLRAGVAAWALKAPAEAAAWVEGMSEDATSVIVVESLVTSWARSDAAAAAAWLDARPSEWRTDPFVVEALARGWARRDPAAAAAWAIRVFRTDDATAAFQQVLGTWAATDPKAAAAALEDAPKELGYFGAASLAFQWAKRAPMEAAEWARQITDSEVRSVAVSQTVKAWAGQAPAAAAAFVTGLDDSHAQTEAAGALLAEWVETDAASASSWLTGLPSGPVRDRSVIEFSVGLFSENPALALSWVQQISDAGLRHDCTEDLVGEWLITHHDAAARWLESSPLPPEMKAELLSEDPPAMTAIQPGIPAERVDESP